MLRKLSILIVLTALAISGVALAEGQHETRTGQAETAKEIKKVQVVGKCPATLQGIRFYRDKMWTHQSTLGISHTKRSEQKIWNYGCDYAEWVRKLWKNRNEKAKEEVQRRTLPETNDWTTAVKIVQRAFPNTDWWLDSCSGAEGGHGEWVIYGGGPYYPGAEYAKTFAGWMVGGPMQYMWPTFKGHYRHGLDSLKSRGFLVDLPPPSDVRAWRSFLAQAIAAGWAKWSGNDGSHWSASSSNGC